MAGDSPPRPHRQTEHLHKGRTSSPGALYFVTIVTEHRTPWLTSPTAQAAILRHLQQEHDAGDISHWAAVIMPDHLHLLTELGLSLSLGRWVARLKSLTRRAAGFAGAWQRDFWEHRLRDAEDVEDYGLYMLLNPYRAGLIPSTEAWPGWWVPNPKRFLFSEALQGGYPPQEWLDWPETRFESLAVGE